MNVFDVGGLVTAIAVIGSAIIGTAIFVGLHKIFNIIHFGFGAMISMWFVCCVVAAFIINIFSGVIGWILSLIWLLLKIALIIGVISLVIKLLHDKISRIKS